VTWFVFTYSELRSVSYFGNNVASLHVIVGA